MLIWWIGNHLWIKNDSLGFFFSLLYPTSHSSEGNNYSVHPPSTEESVNIPFTNSLFHPFLLFSIYLRIFRWIRNLRINRKSKWEFFFLEVKLIINFFFYCVSISFMYSDCNEKSMKWTDTMGVWEIRLFCKPAF